MRVSPIRNDEGYQAALVRASTLIQREDEKSLDELDVIQALVERWERNQYELSSPTAVDAIRFRMLQRGLRPRDLEPYIGSRARVSEILSGKRALSIDMIRALNRHLHIPAASLISEADNSTSRALTLPSKAAMEKLYTFGVMKSRETYESFISRAFPPSSAPALLRKTRTERTNAKSDQSALQAWCASVILKADAIELPTRKKIKPEWGSEIARLSQLEDGPTRVSSALLKRGIIFLVLEHLPGTYLDGAALCRSDGTPVIAMTLRHDRLDNFWFTLIHEYCHAARHLTPDRRYIVDDLDVKGSSAIEDEADTFAQDTLISKELWREHSSPDLDTEGVVALAALAKVGPAVVAGRWQREYQDYRRFSKLLGRGEVRARLFRTETS